MSSIRLIDSRDTLGWLTQYRDSYEAGLRPVISDLKSVEFQQSATEYIDCGASGGDYDYNTPLSISFWYKFNTNHYGFIISKYKGASADGWYIMIYNTSAGGRVPGAPFLGLQQASSANMIGAYCKTSITTGSWCHCVATYDGSGINTGIIFYVNGSATATPVYEGSGVSGTIKNSSQLRMGQSSDSVGGAPLGGKLNEVALYNKVLTLAEAQEIYLNKPTHLRTLSTANNLIHWWRMGDASDAYPNIYDIVGTAHGTMTGMIAGDIVTDAP